MKLNQLVSMAVLASSLAFIAPAEAGSTGGIIGKIRQIHAGPDFHYGVRFYMDIESENLAEAMDTPCNKTFVYTEPQSSGNFGH